MEYGDRKYEMRVWVRYNHILMSYMYHRRVWWLIKYSYDATLTICFMYLLITIQAVYK